MYKLFSVIYCNEIYLSLMQKTQLNPECNLINTLLNQLIEQILGRILWWEYNCKCEEMRF